MSSSFVVVTLTVLLLLTSLFMILLVLIQRGRGGGLAGAFGGMGGQSAFGTRAGDVFTKITVVVAIIFILLASLLGKSMRAAQRDADNEVGTSFESKVDGEAELRSGDDEDAPVLKSEDADESSDAGAAGDASEDSPESSEDTAEAGEDASTDSDDSDSAESDDTDSADESAESETPGEESDAE